MTKPTQEQVEKLAEGYDIVPIQEEIFADLVTPIQILRKLAATRSCVFPAKNKRFASRKNRRRRW